MQNSAAGIRKRQKNIFSVLVLSWEIKLRERWENLKGAEGWPKVLTGRNVFFLVFRYTREMVEDEIFVDVDDTGGGRKKL